jgi:hypothetical protein
MENEVARVDEWIIFRCFALATSELYVSLTLRKVASPTLS